MEFSIDSISNMLLGDWENLFPDCLLDEPSKSLFQDEPVLFKDEPISKPLLTQSHNEGLADEGFPDWLDLKMDLSLLPGLEMENSDDVLNDLLMGEVNTGQSSNFLQTSHMENKAPPLALDELVYEAPFNNNSHRAAADPLSQLISVLSPPYTPPDSPAECLVPDLGIPASPDSIKSEPSSPGLEFVDISPAPTSEIVFTFVAPIIQHLPVIETNEMEVNSDVSVFLEEQEIISEEDVTPVVSIFLKEEEEISSTVEPKILMTKAKKERKRSTPYSKVRRSKSKVKAVLNDDEDFLPVPSTKKERKRMQNKDAATRYRNKKKAEFDVMFDEEDGLLRENQVLKDKAVLLSNEIRYLKGLMKEMFKARGLFK